MVEAGPPSAGRSAMFPPQRHDEILRLAREHGRVDVGGLARAFDVTTETIRRDLSDLQHRRLVRRVHGGAIPWTDDGFEPLMARREIRNVEAKRRIAAIAVEELPPEGTVLFDSGSTTAHVARVLGRPDPLRMVTNSLLITQQMVEHPGADVVMLGGALDIRTLATVDGQTVAAVRELQVDALVIGADGISLEGGLTTPYREQAELKRAMIRAARRVIAVIDSSKVDADQLIRFADWAEVDTLISDDGLDPGLAEKIAEHGVTVVRA